MLDRSTHHKQNPCCVVRATWAELDFEMKQRQAKHIRPLNMAQSYAPAGFAWLQHSSYRKKQSRRHTVWHCSEVLLCISSDPSPRARQCRPAAKDARTIQKTEHSLIHSQIVLDRLLLLHCADISASNGRGLLAAVHTCLPGCIRQHVNCENGGSQRCRYSCLFCS
jgi:hypothetical protein